MLSLHTNELGMQSCALSYCGRQYLFGGDDVSDTLHFHCPLFAFAGQMRSLHSI